MAVSALMWMQGYDGRYLESESQLDLSRDTQKTALHYPPNNNIFEVDSYSLDLEQTLHIGSQPSGSGAGKVSFSPFSIRRQTDKATPVLFQMACSGMTFQALTLVLRKSAGAAAAGVIYLKFTFKLVAIKTISWTYDNSVPTETVTFEYGGLLVQYFQQSPDGSVGAPILGGWNRVKNVLDSDPFSVITMTK